VRSNQLSYTALGVLLAAEPPNGIEPLTFSLPWKRSTD
jgi:hypothetical protein